MVASLLAALALVAAPYDEGTLVTYRGSFLPVKVEQPEAGKSFELTVLYGPTTDESTTVYWLLSDSDRQPMPWMERFNQLIWSRAEKSIEGPIPSFLYDHTTGKTRINVALPLPIFKGELQAGAEWMEDKLQFQVEEGDAVDGRPTWDVIANTLVGRRRTMTLDRENERIYSLQEKVFVGQGEQHTLKYELIAAKTLDREAAAKAMDAMDAWTKVREGWISTTEDRSPKSLAAANKAVAEKLPELKQASAETLLAKLADVAAGQLKSGSEQQAAVGAMRSRLLGKPAPKFNLKDITNKAWSNEALAGKVTVLHFWSYRDENLREPYGQVGYLDFLARQHGDVQVLGIAVAPINQDEQQNQRTFVRKFRDFMNVSYPILLDDGKLLEKLGDPRKVKQELPLFVVIDADGNVAEYKAGEYEVQRNEGLKELEKIVKPAAKPKK